MRNSRPILLMLLSLLIAIASCNRPSKAEQLAALDSAYQSGILTKEEYETKKLALMGPAPAAAPIAPVAPALQAAAPVVATPAPTPVAQPAPVAQPKPPVVKIVPRSARCEEVESKSEQEKQELFFPAPMAKVKKAAATALKNLDFNISRDANNQLEATKKRHIGVIIGAGGEKVTLRFKEAQLGEQKGTRVSGETKRSFTGRVGQKSWTREALAQTACILQSDARR